MPSNDNSDPADDNHPEQAVLTDPSPPSQSDPWASLAAAAGKKKKKKGKDKKNGSTATPTGDTPPSAPANVVNSKAEPADDFFQPTIVPSPPTPPRDNGVRVDVNSPVLLPEVDKHEGLPTVPSPLPSATLTYLDDEISAFKDEDLLGPEEPVARDSPVSPPAIRSPRLAAVSLEPPSSPSLAVRDPVAPAVTRDRQKSPPVQRPISIGYAPSTLHAPASRTDSAAKMSTSPNLPRFVEPPPPHMPQAHFWGLPDLGLNLKPPAEAGRPAGSDGYCCCLDTFTDAGDEVSARKAKDAILVGSEGGLEVFRILPNKLEVVGRLEGLRGSVMAAKILPHTDKFDVLQHLRPLVVVVVHGLEVPGRSDAARKGDKSAGDEVWYQTTVEVYSLQSQQHIASLYKSAAVSGRNGSNNTTPIGELSIAAEGSFITIASGRSGEVFVFTSAPQISTQEVSFRCVGKFWTSLQRTSSSAGRSANDSSSGNSEAQEPSRKPLYSLSSRWLAVVPPQFSSISISGTPLFSDSSVTPPGVATHVAPPQPLVSCEVVGTDIEGTWSRLGRQAAQGLVKYSQRGIEMSWQGWKELTHPTPPGQSNHQRASSKEELFPPTKGHTQDLASLAKEPAVVSIIDLQSLLEWENAKPKHLPAPVATFALVEGCSFLSLSAVGIRLLTSSRKGEVATIWDLTQVAHGVPKQTSPRRGTNSLEDDDADSGPCIRQIHRIVRNSASTILECAWAVDDDAVAILTSNGTVHLHEVPPGLLSSARKRKRRHAAASSSSAGAPNPEKANATVGLIAAGSPPSSGRNHVSTQGFLSTLKSGWQSVSTQVSSLRDNTSATTASTTSASAQSPPGTANSGPANGSAFLGGVLPTSLAGIRDATAAAGSLGSRAVARGLSQGFTAAKGGASEYWHADDNKIRVALNTPPLNPAASTSSLNTANKNSASPLTLEVLAAATTAIADPRRIRWIRHRQNSSSAAAAASSTLDIVIIAGGGVVQVHPVSKVVRRKGDELVRGLKHERFSRKAFSLAPIATRTTQAGNNANASHLKNTCAELGPHGFWSLRRSPNGTPALGGTHSPRQFNTSYHAANDVETNPPYCPFHVDPRVAVFAFDESPGGGNSQYGARNPAANVPGAWEVFRSAGYGRDDEFQHDSSPRGRGRNASGFPAPAPRPWVFGGPLPNAVRLNDRAGFLEDGSGLMGGNDFDLDAGTSVGDDPDFEDYVSSDRGAAGRAGPQARTRPGGGGGGYRDFNDLDEHDELELNQDDDEDMDADPEGAFASQIESRLIISSSRQNLNASAASPAAQLQQQQQSPSSGIRKPNIGSRRGAGQANLDPLSSPLIDDGAAENKEGAVQQIVEDEIRINTRRKNTSSAGAAGGGGAGGKARGQQQQHQGATGGTLNAVLKARSAAGRKGAAS
jgi:hypothetical protein